MKQHSHSVSSFFDPRCIFTSQLILYSKNSYLLFWASWNNLTNSNGKNIWPKLPMLSIPRRYIQVPALVDHPIFLSEYHFFFRSRTGSTLQSCLHTISSGTSTLSPMILLICYNFFLSCPVKLSHAALVGAFLALLSEVWWFFSWAIG